MNTRKFLITLMSQMNGITYHSSWVNLVGPLTEAAIRELATKEGITGNFTVLLIQELEA